MPGTLQVTLHRRDLIAAQGKDQSQTGKIPEQAAALVDGLCIGQRMAEHLLEQPLSSRGMHLIKQAEDRTPPVLAQQVQVVERLFIGNKAHDECILPFSRISRMPSLRMITIPCRSSVMPRSS